MTPLLDILGRASRDLLRPRVIVVVLLPMIAATAIWGFGAWLFWDAWAAWVDGSLASLPFIHWLASWGPAWVLRSLTLLISMILLVPLVFVTALVITEIIAMPIIVAVVGDRYYPGIEKLRGGTVIGSIFNSAIAIGIFALLWIVTLPLWLFGITAILLPALLSAYLNQRLFRYDALAEHAAPGEYRLLCKRSAGRLYVLGLVLAVLYYIPVFNLVVPVLSGLAFTHLCLAELASLRESGHKDT